MGQVTTPYRDLPVSQEDKERYLDRRAPSRASAAPAPTLRVRATVLPLKLIGRSHSLSAASAAARDPLHDDRNENDNHADHHPKDGDERRLVHAPFMSHYSVRQIGRSSRCRRERRERRRWHSCSCGVVPRYCVQQDTHR